MPYLVCRACGHQNDVSARRCAECGAPEEELRAGTDLGPWWPLLGLFVVLAGLYILARLVGRDAVLAWLALAAVACLSTGVYGFRRASLRLRGRGPAGPAARWQGAVLVVLGLAAVAIFVSRLVRGS